VQLLKGSLLEAVAKAKPQEEEMLIEGTKARANPRLEMLKSSLLKNLRLSSTTGKHLKLCKIILPMKKLTPLSMQQRIESSATVGALLDK